MRRTILALLLVCLCLLTACSSAPQETTAPTASETTVPTETEPTETISPVAEEKEVIVYFANWYLDTKPPRKARRCAAFHGIRSPASTTLSGR